MAWMQEAWVPILTLPLTNWVALGRSLPFLEPSFPAGVGRSFSPDIYCALVIPNTGHQNVGLHSHGRGLPSYMGAPDSPISQAEEEDNGVNNKWHFLNTSVVLRALHASPHLRATEPL